MLTGKSFNSVIKDHIDSLPLEDVKIMLTALVVEMKRVKDSGDSDEYYREEYNYLRKTLADAQKERELVLTKEIAVCINSEFKALFPHSHTYIQRGALGGNYYLCVMLGDKETIGTIEQNDLLRHSYDFEITDTGFEITCDGASLSGLKPTENYLYCSRAKIPFRKKTGDLQKCILAMRKHFRAMRDIINDNKENLLPCNEKYKKF